MALSPIFCWRWTTGHVLRIPLTAPKFCRTSSARRNHPGHRVGDAGHSICASERNPRKVGNVLVLRNRGNQRDRQPWLGRPPPLQEGVIGICPRALAFQFGVLGRVLAQSCSGPLGGLRQSQRSPHKLDTCLYGPQTALHGVLQEFLTEAAHQKIPRTYTASNKNRPA